MKNGDDHQIVAVLPFTVVRAAPLCLGYARLAGYPWVA
jgi:hypothetical protein